MSSIKKTRNRSLWNSRLENIDRTLAYLSKRRRDNIRKSLIRPLYQEVLKCIFIVFIMLVDIFIPLQILIDIPMPFNSIGAIVVFIVFLYIEIKAYQIIWGKNGQWSIEKYKITYKKIDQ